MDLSPAEEAIKADLDAYVARQPFRYHPDPEVVRRVIKGLAKRQEATGRAYCPCRLVTGDPEKDEAIVCPCRYHESEIESQGSCHCKLFVAADYEPDA